MWAVKHKSGRVLFVTSDEFIADNRKNMGWIVEEVKMTSRERFEEWIESEHGYHGDDLKFECGRNCYSLYGIHLAWLAWQASRAAIEIELPEEESMGRATGYYAEDVVKAIEQAGLRVKK